MENYDAKVIAYTVILDKMKMLENPHRNNKNWYIEGNSRGCLKWICCGVSLDTFLKTKQNMNRRI